MRLIPVEQAAKEFFLISKPSYYRLAKAKLLPPVVKVSGGRSGVLDSEAESVLAARIAGKNDEEIRQLVRSLVAQRGED